MALKKVLVVGATGSGKSTLAAAVAERLHLFYTPTDPLYWGDNWRRVPLAEVHEWVAALTAEPQRVLDGNFDSAYERMWGRADTVVWLDYPRRVVWWRLVRRNLGWWLSGAPVWSGNRMTLKVALAGIRHELRGYRYKRRTYPEMLGRLSGVNVLRFQRPRDAAL